MYYMYVRSTYVCACICTYVDTYVHMYVYMCAYVRFFIRMSVCEPLYVCMYVLCLYVCLSTHMDTWIYACEQSLYKNSDHNILNIIYVAAINMCLFYYYYQVNHLDKVLLSLINQLHTIETQLYTRLVLLKQFYQKWHHFKLWLNDTRQLLQLSGKTSSSHDVDKSTGSNLQELTRLQVCVYMYMQSCYMLDI